MLLYAGKCYLKVMENAAAFVSNTAGTIHSGYKQGLGGTIQEIAKWSFGVNNFRSGIQALQSKPVEMKKMSEQNSTITYKVITDERSFGQRVKEMGGHFLIGTTKLGVSGMAVTGAVSNFFGYTPSSLLSLHMASKVTGYIATVLGNSALEVATAGAEIAFATTYKAVSMVATNPGQALHYLGTGARLGIAVSAANGGIYMAVSHAIKAAEAEEISEKIEQSFAALICLVGATAIPILVTAI